MGRRDVGTEAGAQYGGSAVSDKVACGVRYVRLRPAAFTVDVIGCLKRACPANCETLSWRSSVEVLPALASSKLILQHQLYCSDGRAKER